MSEGQATQDGLPASPVVIRAARDSDVPAIIGLQEASILGLGVATYGAAKARAWARFGIEQSRDLLSQGHFFIAERDGRAAGVSGWSPDVERADTAWIRYVFVRPDLAGRGIGRRLVSSAEASALAAGRNRFRLWSSLNALRFYERLGYRRVRLARWPVEPGVELDYVLMTRRARGPGGP